MVKLLRILFLLIIAGAASAQAPESPTVRVGLLGIADNIPVLIADKRFVWTVVSQTDLARHGVTFEEVEGLIDIIRRTREADVSCVLKEAPDGTWRVSLRSIGTVDVRHIAEQNGGGGHRFAAGFTSDEPADVVIDKVLAVL